MKDDYGHILYLYEEAGLRESLRVFKYDHEPIADGEWHPLNPSGGIYRVVGDRVQVLIEKGNFQAEERAEVARFLKSLQPLYRDAVEVWIGQKGESYFVRDYRFETSGPHVCVMRTLSRSELKRACDEVRSM